MDVAVSYMIVLTATEKNAYIPWPPLVLKKDSTSKVVRWQSCARLLLQPIS